MTTCGCGFDATDTWRDCDLHWPERNWPVAVDAGPDVCECYDPRSMEFGPGYPCGWCRKNDPTTAGAA